ncbi:unnamed protein product [Orchesella dallaii]|uniref:Uncharacterized protein n=1 Tax=Orchesella dallaii TaxID=48710 RepID=A0ABP1PJU7_9HEXA
MCIINLRLLYIYTGSLTFSSWAVVLEDVPVKRVKSIFESTPSKSLIVVKSLDPLDIVGVIFPTAVENLISKTIRMQDEKCTELPLNKVEDLISTNYTMLPMAGGMIGEIEDAFKSGITTVILYRVTRVYNEEAGVVERKHPIAAVTKADLKRWIGEIENHHNMTSSIENED